MIKIMLACSAGMSTSLLVTKMQDAAKEKGIEAEIWAISEVNLANEIDKCDVLLLGPQVRFQKPQVDALVNGRIPVDVIDMRLYGTMNGKAILEQVIAKIGE